MILFVHDELRATSSELAQNFDHVSHITIGGSKDYGEAGAIGLTRIGDPDGSHGYTYLDGIKL